MDVLAKKAAPARKMRGGRLPEPAPSQSFTFPAPIRGWVLNENLATVQQAGARKLDNWLCTTTGIRARGGCIKYATLTAAVTGLFPYNSTADKFIATTATGVFDASAPASPTTALTAAITGRTSGDYAAAQFGTAGGDFLYLVNGSDKPLLFNGSTFTAIDAASTPAITGVTTTALSQVWSFANRLFFTQKNTMSAWYLPVTSIGGAAQEFSLAGVFKKGGALLFGATWSLDSGDGLDDKCVFVSTEGEVAIYEGTNPGSSTDWRKAGLYQMPKPLGKNAYTQAGGDLLIATEVGLIPVSAAIQSDLAAIESKAVSAPIAPYWQQQARTISSGWTMVKAQRRGVMFVSQPGVANGEALAVNLLTGAWSRCTGWDTRCLGYFGDNAYFGAADSCIYLMDSGGSDNGNIYTALYLGQHEHMGAYGRKKSVRQMRAMFQTGSAINPQVSALADYSEATSAPPSIALASSSTVVWDSALWDVALWDGGATVTMNEGRWTATGVTGTTIAPELQITFGSTVTPQVELVAIDAEFHVGAVVV